MKPILITDGTGGGAAIACSRLLRGLLLAELPNSKWISANGDSSTGATVASTWPPFLPWMVYRIAAGMVKNERTLERHLTRVNGYAVRNLLRRSAPSLISVHNIHGNLDFDFMNMIPASIPIVWTLHDMWPLTGYCCYSYECEKYLNGCCGECPQLEKWGTVLQEPADGWKNREAFFAANRDRLVFVSPSRWLAECAKRRTKEAIRIECIPYGLDLGVYMPLSVEKKQIRRLLGIPEHLPFLLAGAKSNVYARKGIAHLAKAIRLLRESGMGDFSVVTFGAISSVEKENGFISMGNIKEERYMNLLYNAADVFVLPSLADNLPNTLLEATAAGTPCVTFNVGGCPEVVRNGATGFVAKYKDEANLAECIKRVLILPEAEKMRMRENCRRLAEQEYAIEVQGRRYKMLFEEIVEEAAKKM